MNSYFVPFFESPALPGLSQSVVVSGQELAFSAYELPPGVQEFNTLAVGVYCVCERCVKLFEKETTTERFDSNELVLRTSGECHDPLCHFHLERPLRRFDLTIEQELDDTTYLPPPLSITHSVSSAQKPRR